MYNFFGGGGGPAGKTDLNGIAFYSWVVVVFSITTDLAHVPE